MTTLRQTFDNLLEQQRKLREEFQATAQELFKQTTKQFFDQNPGVTAIHWTQYTPYFNDGDECVFRIGDIYFTNATPEQFEEDVTSWGDYEGEDENVWSEYAWGFKYHKDRYYEGINIDQAEEFSKLVGSSDMEEVMEAMFGDHVRVVATREGFDVREYDHD
jgi:hypothetical protein